MTRLEVRNLPAGQLRGYLVDELAGVADGDTVRGDGWVVRFIQGEPARLRLMTIAVLFIEIEGAREDEVAAFMRNKTMRGGG
ncbi:MAG: hypothetical protein AAB349_03485 [Chloroflexota bacterium]